MQIELGEVLGQGAFGTTYRSTWRGATIAVKCVRVAAGTELSNFLREVEALSMLRHPHVLPFLGACLQVETNHCWLLAELMAGGTLSEWLHQPDTAQGTAVQRRPFVERLRMAYEVRSGLYSPKEVVACLLTNTCKILVCSESKFPR